MKERPILIDVEVSERTEIWTQEEAVSLCRAIESFCPNHGCHVALTGGLLYKDGPRKDCDILFYRIRQEEIDFEGLKDALTTILGFTDWSGFGWCVKARRNGKSIDIFFPEELEGSPYP